MSSTGHPFPVVDATLFRRLHGRIDDVHMPA